MTTTPSARPGGPSRFDVPIEASAFMERLEPSARERLTAMLRPATFEPGETVIREGGPTPFLGIVVRGRIALRVHVPERGPMTVLTIDPGELLGWSALVAPHRSTATAVALEPTRIAAFDVEPLAKAMQDDPAFAAAVLARVLESVAGRLGESWDQLLDLFRGSGVEPW
jgi:CRP-like cAMP-binding protein